MNVRPFLATAVLGLLAPVPACRHHRSSARTAAGRRRGTVRTESLPESMACWSAAGDPARLRCTHQRPPPARRRPRCEQRPSQLQTSRASRFTRWSRRSGRHAGQSYSIAPGVQGTVTIATSARWDPPARSACWKACCAEQRAHGLRRRRYNIVPPTRRTSGWCAHRSPSQARGFESRVVPLRYVSAAEMERSSSPTPSRLDRQRGWCAQPDHHRRQPRRAREYIRTIQVFDVDWMASMSVGVFPLQSAAPARWCRTWSACSASRARPRSPGVPLHAAGYRQRV